MADRLADATSPYLLQHRDNPVDWRLWSAETLAEARAADKPILLSIGYAACHWCHVMAHESFEDEDIAALMNREFVNVKVDREERPDLDAHYQRALARLGQQGGWPLTMILDTDGAPLWGGTYFPPTRRYGRPGFPEVLERVADLWKNDRAKMLSSKKALSDAIAESEAPHPGEPPSAEEDRGWARALAGHLDPIHGGLGGAPKFPQAPLTDWLWSTSLATKDPIAIARLRHGATQMAEGGIWDHLGGGLARYSTDAYWLAPHFEKMLYDNAQFLRHLAELHRAEPNPLYAARAAELVAWLERDLRIDDAYASAFDADSEGEEGKFYVWSETEIDEALGDAASAFKLAYGVNATGNWEGSTILNRLHEQGWRGEDEEAALAQSRENLRELRDRSRIWPMRDDKILSEWNALMIAALADAAFAFDQPAWLGLAERTFDAVNARAGATAPMGRGWRDDRAIAAAFAEDSVAMARAAWALYEASGDAERLAQCRAILAAGDAAFAEESGAYRQAPRGALDAPPPTTPIADGPTPAANATLLWVLAALAHGAGDDDAGARAEKIARLFAGAVRANPAAHGAYLRALSLLREPATLFVVERDEGAGAALRAIALAHRTPDLLVMTIDEARAAALPASHPAHAKTARGETAQGAAAAYLCVDRVCLPPIAETETLCAALRARFDAT